MVSTFPTSPDNLSTANTNDTSSYNTHKDLHNDANAAINAIESFLVDVNGNVTLTSPSGSTITIATTGAVTIANATGASVVISATGAITLTSDSGATITFSAAGNSLDINASALAFLGIASLVERLNNNAQYTLSGKDGDGNFQPIVKAKITSGDVRQLSFFDAALVAQGALVSDASGGSTVDTQARTAINTLLARMRAVGLIAT